MLGFFKKRKEEARLAEARSRAFQEVIQQMANGSGNKLEAALVLHLVEPSQESLTRFLITFGGSDVFVLNRGNGRLGDPSVSEGPDGSPYVLVFSSRDRAAAGAAHWELPTSPSPVSALEIVFTLSEGVGILLNGHEPHLRWEFTPQQVANLRKLYEGSHEYQTGGIYSVWGEDRWRVAKILKTDDGGVHLRLYSNAWPERPTAVDPASLVLGEEGEGMARGIGHMPVTRVGFLATGPILLTRENVTEDELDGYKLWSEAKGGYFGG